MLHKTRAIILHQFQYNDRYAIVHVYTEAFGPVAYLTAATKTKTSRVPKALLHPLSIVELEVEHHNLREIQRIKEAKACMTLPAILSHPVKTAVSMFMAELISKFVKEQQPDQALFDFLLQSIRILELSEKSFANFHLVFLMKLSRFLGFYPDVSAYRRGMFFDMQNGVFITHKPAHHHFLNPDDSAAFVQLLRMDYENMSHFRFSGKERKAFISRAIEYYQIHLSHFQEIKSVEILHEVFG